jgi:serine/threonine protein kinase
LVCILRFQIHPFPIDERIFGTALRAFDGIERQDVYLKLIKDDIFAKYKEFIFREVEMLVRLNHPNIIQCYGYCSEKEKFYIFFEFVDGVDLQSYFKKNKHPLQENIVLSFFSQLVSELSYAHSFKIIYRDLKSYNILLTKDNKIKIFDFNYAKTISTLFSSSDKLVGIPEYVSPDVLTQKCYSFPADIWSLGFIIYELMTGKPPFFIKIFLN